MAVNEQIGELLPVDVGEAEETELDELREELLPRPSEDDERELARAILADYKAALDDRAQWEDNLADWEEQYLGVLPAKNFPWPGAANFHVPLTMTGVETLKPRLTESVLGANPPIWAIPTEGTDQERQERVQLFMNWRVQTDLKLRPVVEESAHLFLIPGTVYAKTHWHVNRRHVRALRTFDPEMPVDEILDTLFEHRRPTDLTQDGPLSWHGTLRGPGGTSLPVRVRFKITVDEIQALVDRETVIAEGPKIDLIAPEDVIVPVRAPKSVAELPFIQHRLWLYEHELLDKVKRGRFYADAVDELINRTHEPSDSEAQMDSERIREQRMETQGLEPGESDVRSLQYEVLEDYRKWDVDGDGELEEVIVWVSPTMDEKILGWDYLDNVYAHGERPIVVGRYQSQPFQFYGLSFAQIVQDVQEEINTMHNQRVDYGTLQNTPFYIYRASSTHTGIFRLRPGEGIPMDNPQQDVVFPRWQGSPQFGQAEEAILYQYFERLTGITDLALGRQPNRVGATRTATGTASLLSEASLRFKNGMVAFQGFWEQVLHQVLALDQAYLPPGIEFRVTGRWPEVMKIQNRADIRGKYDIRLAATDETLNRAVVREDATIRMQAVFNPIAMQLGLVGLKGLRKTYRDFLRAYGEPDPDSIVEPERRQMIVRSPNEELAILLSDGEITPNPAEDVQAHVVLHTAQLADPTVQTALGVRRLRILQQHLAQTIQLAQVQAAASQLQSRGAATAGGTPMAGSQAANAQTGRNAANQPSNNAAEQTAQTGGEQGGPASALR